MFCLLAVTRLPGTISCADRLSSEHSCRRDIFKLSVAAGRNSTYWIEYFGIAMEAGVTTIFSCILAESISIQGRKT